MDKKKYNVTILHTQSSDSITSQLAKLFKISTEKAQNILQKDFFLIKKQTDKATAEKFHKAITDAGVNCRIDEIIDEEESELPTIEEVKTSTQAKPLTDITRPAITPLHEEQANLTLADGPVEKNAETNQIKPIDNINPENFCPECGTIRASADSVCIHCDYDPITLKHNNAKATLIKVVAVTVILAICIGIGLPFYQQYAKRMKVENDLTLAFNTRNAVTAFIQETNFWPNQNIDAGLDKDISNQSIKSINIDEGTIIRVVIRASVLDGEEQTLILTPNTLKGRIVWNCLKGSLEDKFRPEICRARAAKE